MRACGASELRKCSHFHRLKLLFQVLLVYASNTLSVQINDMLVGFHVPTKLRKSIMGGGGGQLSPPPRLC